MRQLVERFAADGFLVLPAVLTPHQVRTWNRAIDADRARFPRLWRDRGEGGRTQSVHALLCSPELDEGLFHPRLLPLVRALLGEDAVCEEHSVMLRGPIDGEPPATAWHRDTGHDAAHPLALHALSLIYYLTDVDETTHCFGVVPESTEAKRGAHLPAADGAGGRDLTGPAGTAILFNAGSCHAGRLRRTPRERRTVHIYYGRAGAPPLSEHTILPRRLLQHADADVRRLFGRPNEVTRAVHGLDGA